MSRASSQASGIASPSPVSRLQTHISFEDLDDFVQIQPAGKWDNKLSVAFPSVVLSADMIVTVCVAIKQSVKSISHDSTLLLNLDMMNAELSDESFLKILSTAAPSAMRKSGRIAFSNLKLGGNALSDRSLEEIVSILVLNREAKYKYRAKVLVAGTADFSGNKLQSIKLVESFMKTASSADGGGVVLVNFENNQLDVGGLKKLVKELGSQASLCEAEEGETESVCAGLTCVSKCRFHITNNSLGNQLPPEVVPAIESVPETGESGFVTPAPEPEQSSRQPSIEEMTKALLAGLKITPDSVASDKKPPPSEGTEDISKSLLNLLHASASKLKSGVHVAGRSVADLEASMRPPKPAAPAYSAVRAPLRVFTPFPGATPLCGLELRVDPLGYRVVRVTEKPGQDGNIREGDVITAIDGEPLVALPGIGESDREKAIRNTFGKRLKDGVQLIIQRPINVHPEDLNPDASVIVERRLDFGLMLLGAGIDWRMLISKMSVAQQQAMVICQGLGIEGKLETTSPGPDASPALWLKGPAGSVDKAMRQFCVVIVKAALLQQQQEQNGK